MATTLTMAVLDKIESKKAFIETGSLDGDGIRMALQAGYETVFSIELDVNKFNACTHKFRNNNKVKVLHGDSKDVLPVLINNFVLQEATLWLDAHALGTEEPVIVTELTRIAQGKIRTHTLLIDDMRLVRGKQTWGGLTSIDELEQLVYGINENYVISYVANTIAHDDILMAEVPSWAR